MISSSSSSSAAAVFVFTRAKTLSSSSRMRSFSHRAASCSSSSSTKRNAMTFQRYPRRDHPHHHEQQQQQRKVSVLKRTTRGHFLATMMATSNDGNESSKEEEKEDIPPWERREMEKKLSKESGEFPWPVFLLGSLITLLAATGSVFEWTFSKPIFGVVDASSGMYKPILGWFIVTGFPLSAILWTKGIEGANKASELTDKMDGYD